MWCPKQNVCVFSQEGVSIVVILGFPSFWNGVNSSGFFCRFACIRHWGVLHVLSATGHCVGTPRSRWSKSANDSPALSSLTTSPMRAADMNQVEPPIYVAELSLTCVFSARSSWQFRGMLFGQREQTNISLTWHSQEKIMKTTSIACPELDHGMCFLTDPQIIDDKTW